jgi:hypothetical protein
VGCRDGASRPILRRLDLEAVAVTTPFEWEPPEARTGEPPSHGGGADATMERW